MAGPRPSGLDLAGMVITLDALHAQREAARLIAEDHGGHYLMFVKANQPTLLAQVTAALEGTDDQFAGPPGPRKEKATAAGSAAPGDFPLRPGPAQPVAADGATADEGVAEDAGAVGRVRREQRHDLGPCSTVEGGVMPTAATIAVFMKVAGCRQFAVTWAAASSLARSKVNAASASCKTVILRNGHT